MNTIFWDIIGAIVSIVVPVVATFVVKWLKQRIGAANAEQLMNLLQTKKGLALQAVQFVRAAYADLGGEEKFESARKKLVELANHYSLPISSPELSHLVSEAVQQLRDEFLKQMASEAQSREGSSTRSVPVTVLNGWREMGLDFKIPSVDTDRAGTL